MSDSVGIKNRYWVLRHGKSIPNERGLIVSSMVVIKFYPIPLLSISKPLFISSVKLNHRKTARALNSNWPPTVSIKPNALQIYSKRYVPFIPNLWPMGMAISSPTPHPLFILFVNPVE